MSIFKTIFPKTQEMSDAQALTLARSWGLKRPKDAPGTPMFKAWRKLIVEAKIATELHQDKICEQAIADANFIALTMQLPTRDDFIDNFLLRGAESSARTADLLTRHKIEESKKAMKTEMMELSDSVLLKLKRDLMAIPITDPKFEVMQDWLAVCESVQRARLTKD